MPCLQPTICTGPDKDGPTCEVCYLTEEVARLKSTIKRDMGGDYLSLQALYIQQLNTRKLMAEVIAEYAKHDSWRCDYYRECHCGLWEACDEIGIERTALPEKPKQ